MYVIRDTFGTRQTAWTRRAALEWLAAAGPEAWVEHRLTGVLLFGRVVTA